MPRLDSSFPLDPGTRITAERVETALRTRFDPLPTLNPQRLVQYLQQFERGYLDEAARTWEAMERRDDRLASVSAKAKSAVARYGFEVRVRPNLPPALREQAAKHQAALEYLYTHCTVTNAVRGDEQGGFSLLVHQMADAIGKRYSVHEILWEPSAGGQHLTATFRHAPLWFFEATTGKLRYKQAEGATAGVEMDPDAWLVTVGEGIMEACSVLWVYKHLPLRDWLSYSEKFGLPYLLGKTQATFNSQEWQAMVAALRGFGNDGAAVVGGSDDIVPVQGGSGSEATPFPGLVERSERAMSILWRGADLGTQAHSGTGQGQGASLQGEETAALDEDRAAWLSESLASVSRTAIKYLFGEGVQPLAYVRLKTQVAGDIRLDLAVDTFLLSNGAPVSVADVLARYGRPTPAPGEPLLQSPGTAGGGAKAAASEEATLASIERAANAVVAAAAALVAAGNFNPYHDKLGRFTTRDGVSGPGQSKLIAFTSPEDARESGDEDLSDEDKEDEKDRPVLPAPSVFEKLASVLGIKDSPRRDPQGVRRKNHHVVPVQILQENNLSKDIIAELEKLKIPPGLPHGWSKAHDAYNQRVREIVAQFVKLIKTVNSDPEILSGPEAREFAEKLAELVGADPYCKKFNEMIRKGSTRDELNAMLAGAERLVKAKPALMGKLLKGSGTLMKKVDALLGPIGDIANLVFVLSDAYENGPNQATINFFKAATFYDVTAEPLLQGTVKAMDGLLNWGGPEADNPMHMKALMKNMDEQSSSKW